MEGWLHVTGRVGPGCCFVWGCAGGRLEPSGRSFRFNPMAGPPMSGGIRLEIPISCLGRGTWFTRGLPGVWC